ncbi:MAG TPA: hypothetical protein VHU84_15095 [Lacipirellulaceae bacterium]|jgi:hypothetical protein|nr:hypothetical protein [Lacipirellulaceae bacterium]
MEILSQFLLRLAFGLAVGMAITSSQKVFSGFYRNHLYVVLGLTTLAALVLAHANLVAACLASVGAALSFIGAAAWLYEAKRLGMRLIVAAAASSLIAAWLALPNQNLWHSAALVTSGLVLGVVFASMLLGHWYLNAPGMELEPLRRLLVAAAAAIAAQMLVVGAGLIAELMSRTSVPLDWTLFIVLRWSFGLLGVLGLLWMAWQTLKIPNTQSATGILYVAVLGVFIGELTGLLLSAESAFPL